MRAGMLKAGLQLVPLINSILVNNHLDEVH
jgi:hypothetical protein